MFKNKKIIIISSVVVFVILAGYVAWKQVPRLFFKPTPSDVEDGIEIIDFEDFETVSVVAQNLQIPWEIEFLPNGDMLATERPGTLRLLGETNRTYTIDDVNHTGEGGLLGMALHPNFEQNRYLYLYLTVSESGEIKNRVDRYVYTQDGELEQRETILQGIPGARFHNGGRMAFGPDGYLYITVGDAQNTSLAQIPTSLAGKILRVQDDGSVPPDNPFGNEVYTLGHRNPQGITWDDEGNMWATEHGNSANDELNLIVKGQNYGWPLIEGNQSAPGMITPATHSGNAETWAPGGMIHMNGNIFFGGLRGQALFEVLIGDDLNVLGMGAHFRQEIGRIRAVKIGPDGYVYVSTSNRDGRGTVQTGDDKIIKFHPSIFNRE